MNRHSFRKPLSLLLGALVVASAAGCGSRPAPSAPPAVFLTGPLPERKPSPSVPKTAIASPHPVTPQPQAEPPPPPTPELERWLPKSDRPPPALKPIPFNEA